MILDFPHKSVLQLVLQGGPVPLKIMENHALFSYGEDGHVFLEFDQRLPNIAAKRLHLLGICRSSRHPTEQVFSAHCWYQAIPLEKDTNPNGEGIERIGNVIFQINDEEYLRLLVEEILRLGNDRMALLCYRHVNSNEFVALLHVNRPPYYTLLKALEPDIVSHQRFIFAYYEQTPRCWVELGWKYPLAHIISIPENRRLFIRAPHHWEFFDDAPFQNIYQSLDIQIPTKRCLWQAQDQVSKIPIPLRLIPGDPHRVEPSLWLVPGGHQLDFEGWLRGVDENILKRLSFAVAEAPDQEHEKWIVLHAETYGEALPPVILNLDVAYPYVVHPLMRNIYLPRGYALHPLVRVETLQRLLEADTDQIVWLRPLDNQAFQPCALSLSVFRRLSEWIDYLITQHHVVLKEWVDATVFDWPSDIQQVAVISGSDDGGSPPPSAAQSPASPDEKAHLQGQNVGNEVARLPKERRSLSSHRGGKTPAGQKTGAQQPPHLAWRDDTSLRELEQRFSQVPGNRLDDSERVRLWPELALAYSQANLLDQAALCWLHALWHCEPADVLPLFNHWFKSEWQGKEEPHAKQWQQILNNRLVTQRTVQRILVSLIYWTLKYPEHCTADFLQAFQQFVEENQEMIPLRGQWLAYHLLNQKLGDSLLLPRCADHLLNKLVADPSIALRDLPRFLHKGSLQYQRIFHKFKDQLSGLLDDLIRWTKLSCRNIIDRYSPYVYYTFAYLAARLEMLTECKMWMKKAEETSNQVFSGDIFSDEIGGEVSKLYVSIIDRAYKHRINEAANKLSPSSKLPQDVHEIINKLKSKCEQLPREFTTLRKAYYIVNRLLQKSELLEPLIQEDAFLVYLKTHDYLEGYDDTSMMGYLRSLRETLVQIFSAKSLDLQRLWSDFTERFRKLFDEFPISGKATDSEDHDYCQEVIELRRIYTHAFNFAGLYGHQRWIDDLLNILCKHVDILDCCHGSGMSLAVKLISELVPTALYLERICHNLDVLRYIRQKLQPWSITSSKTFNSMTLETKHVQGEDKIDDMIIACISASVICIKEEMEKKHNVMERLHQYILSLDPNIISKNRYVNIIVNYIKIICSLGSELSIDYIYKYFNDCNSKGIYISFSSSSDEYLSLHHIQIIESLKYAIDTILGSGLSPADLRNDWQIENEYLLRRRIIQDLKESCSSVT